MSKKGERMGGLGWEEGVKLERASGQGRRSPAVDWFLLWVQWEPWKVLGREGTGSVLGSKGIPPV